MNIKRKKRINRFEVDGFPLLDLGTRNLCRSIKTAIELERLTDAELDRYETIFEGFTFKRSTDKVGRVPADKIFRNEVMKLTNLRDKINTHPLTDFERSLWYEVYFPVREDVRNKIPRYNLKYVGKPVFWCLDYPLKSTSSTIRAMIMGPMTKFYSLDETEEIISRSNIKRKRNTQNHLMLI